MPYMRERLINVYSIQSLICGNETLLAKEAKCFHCLSSDLIYVRRITLYPFNSCENFIWGISYPAF